MDTLIAECKKRAILPHMDTIFAGYNQTPPTSKLRLFLARTYVYVTLASDDAHTQRHLPKEKMRAIVVENEDLCYDTFALLPSQSGKAQVDLRDAEACDHHSHDKGISCPYGSAGVWKEPFHSLKVVNKTKK